MKRRHAKIVTASVVGWNEIPDGCSMLTLPVSVPTRVTHVLAWDAARETILNRLDVGISEQLVQPVPLKYFQPRLPIVLLANIGQWTELAGTECGVFFRLSELSPFHVELVQACATPLDLETASSNRPLSIGFSGPVSAVAVLAFSPTG